LDKLGFLPAPLNAFKTALARPYGMILVTGPTGSGKSTTLYSVITQLNSSELNIVTLEEPVEYELEGITQIQAIQANGRLHLLVTNRSHDIFKAAIPNAFGLRMVQKALAEELQFPLGQLQITSQSAHIYEQDWENASQLVRCRFWERSPDLVFDPAIHGDPRGNVVISIEGEKIVAVLQGGEGVELARIEGKTAAEVGLKITHLDLLSRHDHLIDVGIQLEKAEIAMKKNLTFQQDKQLIF